MRLFYLEIHLLFLESSLITSFAWSDQIFRSVQGPVGLSRLRSAKIRSFVSSLESSFLKRELFSPKGKRCLKQCLSLSVFRKELKHNCNSKACAKPFFGSRNLSTCVMLNTCSSFVALWFVDAGLHVKGSSSRKEPRHIRVTILREKLREERHVR